MTPNPKYPNYPTPDPALIEQITQEAAALVRLAHAAGVEVTLTRQSFNPPAMGHTFTQIEVYGARLPADTSQATPPKGNS